MEGSLISISFASGAASVGGVAIGTKLLMDFLGRRRNGNGRDTESVQSISAEIQKAIADVKRDTKDSKDLLVNMSGEIIRQTAFMEIQVSESKEQTRLLGEIARKGNG